MIVAIYTKSEEGGSMQRRDSVTAEPGFGLDGDHYGNRARAQGGTLMPKAQVTLTATEALVACQREFGLHLRPGECRRNLITVGVSLNDLVGRTFKVGDSAVLKGIELCEPCAGLEKMTGLAGLVTAMKHRGGLRAQVIEPGDIREGDSIIVE